MNTTTKAEQRKEIGLMEQKTAASGVWWRETIEDWDIFVCGMRTKKIELCIVELASLTNISTWLVQKFIGRTKRRVGFQMVIGQRMLSS